MGTITQSKERKRWMKEDERGCQIKKGKVKCPRVPTWPLIQVSTSTSARASCGNNMRVKTRKCVGVCVSRSLKSYRLTVCSHLKSRPAKSGLLA